MTTEPEPGTSPPPAMFPTPDPAFVAFQLAEVRQQAGHYATLLAAITTKIGPIRIAEDEYHNADPNRFGSWQETSERALTFGFRDTHITPDGLVTREAEIVAVLEQHRGADPAVQARAVLAVLGLPITPEA